MPIRRLVISLAVATLLIAPLVSPCAQAATWGKAGKNKAAATKDENHQLTDTSGPWLIMAATFTGDGAEDQARQLARELRKELKQNAYTYQKKFDFSKPMEGRGVDRQGGPQMMRYEHDDPVVEIAVLVGDYEQVGDALAQKTLKRIKFLKPDALTKVEKTSQTMAAIHAIQRAAIPHDEKVPEKGPMGGAFLTTNPLLPRDYFVPKGLDKFVVDMNKGVKHSLLDCKGKYSVKVATFTGQNILLTRKVVDQMERGKTLNMKSRLIDAAEKAHKLTEALRAKGVQAYEFHDRASSIVTIGSFDSIGTPQPNGQIELNPQIHAIMQQYGADKSITPGQAPQVGRAKSEAGIPFDVQPLPVEVPRRSIGADYGGTAMR
ncbi:MAG TPA: hypothetical protein VHY91_19675 [Pirellulales bacterium]|jgi:hypothetical protein|nr:hypothetical protein [Pirellulales bacterium]